MSKKKKSKKNSKPKPTANEQAQPEATLAADEYAEPEPKPVAYYQAPGIADVTKDEVQAIEWEHFTVPAAIAKPHGNESNYSAANGQAEPVVALTAKDFDTIESGHFTFTTDFSKPHGFGSSYSLAAVPGRPLLNPAMLEQGNYSKLSDNLYQYIPGSLHVPATGSEESPGNGCETSSEQFLKELPLPCAVQQSKAAVEFANAQRMVETAPTSLSSSTDGNTTADGIADNIDIPCEHCGCTPGIEEYQECIINDMEEDKQKKELEYKKAKRKEEEARILFALELEKLRKKAESSKLVLDKFKDKLKAAESERDNSNTRLKVALATSASLEEQLKATGKELEEIRKKQGYSQSDIDKVEFKLRNSEIERADTDLKLKDALETSADLNEQVTALKKGLERFRKKLDSQQALVDELQDELQTSESERASLDLKLKDALASSPIQPEQLEASEREKKELRGDVIRLEGEIEAMEDELRGSYEENGWLRYQIDDLVKDYKKLESEVAELKEASDNNCRKLEETQKELEDAIRCRKTLEEKLPAAEETVRRLEESLSALRSANQTLAWDANYLDRKFRAASKTREDLRKKLQIHLADNDTLRAQIEESRCRLVAKETEYKTLQQEFVDMQDLHQTLAMTDKKYEYAKDNQLLRAQNAVLKSENKDLSSSLKDEKDNYSVLQHKNEDLTSKLNVLKQDNFRLTVTQERTVQDLRTKVVELERDRVLMAPIIQSIADARLGFLESARFVVRQSVGWEQNKEIMWKARHASHHGNGRLDATLFKTGLVPKDYREIATKIFEELYSILPSRYGGWGPKASRVGDCNATVKSLTPFCREKKAWGKVSEFQQVVKFLNGFRNSMSDEAFESSPQVDTWVLRLETLTDDIAELAVARPR